MVDRSGYLANFEEDYATAMEPVSYAEEEVGSSTSE